MYIASALSQYNPAPLGQQYGNYLNVPAVSQQPMSGVNPGTPQIPVGNVGKLGTMDYANLALGGIQTVGNIWAAWQAQKLAREQFKYTKKVTDTNLANQIQSYNTGLEDKIRARSFTEGRADGYADNYLAKHKLEEYNPG